MSVKQQCITARKHKNHLSSLSSQIKNAALEAGANSLLEHQDKIIAANQKDRLAGKQNGLSKALLDRLSLTPERIHAMAQSLRIIKDLKDPLNQTLAGWRLPNGLQVTKTRVPIGLIGIIYEARPNVTVDAIGLAIKSGNAVVLRGSASAYQSNQVLTQILTQAFQEQGVPAEAFQLLEDVSRESVTQLIQLNGIIDMVIPRGGAGLIQHVVQHATVPAIETGVGNCHIYIDKTANLDMAKSVIINAKTQRPSVCNACESVLVHKDVASDIVPDLVKELTQLGVEVRGDDAIQQLATVTPAIPEDWDEEYLDLILAMKVVDSVESAISHIDQHGTQHSEAIISEDYTAIKLFKQSIDAAAVLVNCSTRFIDGGEFGFGAEMGISTQKLHARGPMGLTELTTYKYIVEGTGQVKE